MPPRIYLFVRFSLFTVARLDRRGSCEGVLGGSQRRHSTVLSSSESSRLTLGQSVDATEFLKGEMWARSKMPSSSTSMMGMSRLQKESVRTEKRS